MSFQHVIWRPLPYSMGVPIGSDWQDKPDTDEWRVYRECGFWTEGEVSLLFSVACQFQGRWIEIGAHSGWCSNSIAEACLPGANQTPSLTLNGTYETPENVAILTAIEPMFSNPEWYQRFAENVSPWLEMGRIMPWAGRSDQYFATWDGGGGRTFDGALIDGDHAGGVPLADAKGVYDRLNPRGVVLLHDFRGPEVWDAAKYLVDRGMQFKVYPSVHMVCVCWRGEFNPPPVFQEGDVNWAKHYGLPGWAK